jgi:hypothetical protein
MGNDLGITASGMLVSGNDANSFQGGLIETIVWDGTDWSRVTQESGEEYLLAPTQAGTTAITSDGRYLFRMRLDNATNEQNNNQFEFSRYENMGNGVWGNPLSFATSSPYVMSYRTAPNWSSDDGHYAAILLIDGLTNEKRVDIYTDLPNCVTSTPAPTTPTPAPTTPAPTTPAPTTTTTTTVAPPFVPQYDNLFVGGGEFGGCYTRTSILNGRHSYSRQVNDRSYLIYYDGDKWRMLQSAPVTSALPVPYSNTTPFDSLSPPITGWVDGTREPVTVNLSYSNCT